MFGYPAAAPTLDELYDWYGSDPDYVISEDPQFVIDCWHPGATTLVRIWKEGAIRGNQAAYDANGDLIGYAPSYGTPDEVSPAAGWPSIPYHFMLDTAPVMWANLLDHGNVCSI